jgi:hypothetical protein
MEQIMEINQSQDQTDKSQLKERLKSVLFPSLPEDNRIEKTAINTEQYKVEKKEELQTEITPVKKHDSIRKGKEADLKKLIALHSEKQNGSNNIIKYFITNIIPDQYSENISRSENTANNLNASLGFNLSNSSKSDLNKISLFGNKSNKNFKLSVLSIKNNPLFDLSKVTNSNISNINESRENYSSTDSTRLINTNQNTNKTNTNNNSNIFNQAKAESVSADSISSYTQNLAEENIVSNKNSNINSENYSNSLAKNNIDSNTESNSTNSSQNNSSISNIDENIKNTINNIKDIDNTLNDNNRNDFNSIVSNSHGVNTDINKNVTNSNTKSLTNDNDISTDINKNIHNNRNDFNSIVSNDKDIKNSIVANSNESNNKIDSKSSTAFSNNNELNNTNAKNNSTVDATSNSENTENRTAQVLSTLIDEYKTNLNKNLQISNNNLISSASEENTVSDTKTTSTDIDTIESKNFKNNKNIIEVDSPNSDISISNTRNNIGSEVKNIEIASSNNSTDNISETNKIQKPNLNLSSSLISENNTSENKNIENTTKVDLPKVKSSLHPVNRANVLIQRYKNNLVLNYPSNTVQTNGNSEIFSNKSNENNTLVSTANSNQDTFSSDKDFKYNLNNILNTKNTNAADLNQIQNLNEFVNNSSEILKSENHKTISQLTDQSGDQSSVESESSNNVVSNKNQTTDSKKSSVLQNLLTDKINSFSVLIGNRIFTPRFEENKNTKYYSAETTNNAQNTVAETQPSNSSNQSSISSENIFNGYPSSSYFNTFDRYNPILKYSTNLNLINNEKESQEKVSNNINTSDSKIENTTSSRNSSSEMTNMDENTLELKKAYQSLVNSKNYISENIKVNKSIAKSLFDSKYKTNNLSNLTNTSRSNNIEINFNNDKAISTAEGSLFKNATNINPSTIHSVETTYSTNPSSVENKTNNFNKKTTTNNSKKNNKNQVNNKNSKNVAIEKIAIIDNKTNKLKSILNKQNIDNAIATNLTMDTSKIFSDTIGAENITSLKNSIQNKNQLHSSSEDTTNNMDFDHTFIPSSEVINEIHEKFYSKTTNKLGKTNGVSSAYKMVNLSNSKNEQNNFISSKNGMGKNIGAMPALRAGGFVKTPTVAYLHENEAVVPLEKSKEFSKFVSDMRSGGDMRVEKNETNSDIRAVDQEKTTTTDKIIREITKLIEVTNNKPQAQQMQQPAPQINMSGGSDGAEITQGTNNLGSVYGGSSSIADMFGKTFRIPEWRTKMG